MNLKFRNLLLGFLALGSTQASAQKVYSLEDCLDIALKNSANIAVKKLEQENVEQQIINTRSRALPQVNGNANFTDNYKVPVLVLPPEAAAAFTGSNDGKPLALPAGVPYSMSAGAEATQTLFDKSVFDGLQAAKAGRQYAELDTRLTEEDVINQVASSYYTILATTEELYIDDSTINKITRLKEATQASYDNGLAKKTDLDRIKVRLINLEAKRDEAASRMVQQSNRLKVLMGVSISEPLAITQLSFSDVEKAANSFSPGIFNRYDRTEIKLLESQNTLLELQRKATQAEYFPKLSAFVNYSYNGSSTSFGDIFKSGGGDVYYGMGAFGLRLSVPIFDGFAKKSRVAMNNIQIQELKLQQDYTALQLDAAWANANDQLKTSIKNIRTQRENKALAEAVFNASQTNFDLGLASLTDLLDAQASYLESENSYTQSLLKYKLAELEILRSQGNIRSLIK